MKVSVGGGKFVHLKVFVPLPYTGNPPSLSDSVDGKTDSDAMSY
jgi:hypothetical protein